MFAALQDDLVESTVSPSIRRIRFSWPWFPFTLLACTFWTASSALPLSNLSSAMRLRCNPSLISRQRSRVHRLPAESSPPRPPRPSVLPVPSNSFICLPWAKPSPPPPPPPFPPSNHSLHSSTPPH